MSTKPIGTLGAVDSVTIGGRTFTDTANLITLVARVGNTNKSTFRKPSATSGYTPSGSKTFVISAVKIYPNGSSVGAPALVYSDNDVGMNGSTAFTNKVYQAGDVGAAGLIVGTTAAAPFTNEYSTAFTIPNAKYAGIEGVQDTVVYVYGYEV